MKVTQSTQPPIVAPIEDLQSQVNQLKAEVEQLKQALRDQRQ